MPFKSTFLGLKTQETTWYAVPVNKTRIITIAGKPGSGKTTTANLVAQSLSYRRFSSGDFMREIAKSRNVSLAELQGTATTDRSIDDIVDGKLREIGTTEKDLVIDSRLAFHWIPQSFKVYLDLDLDLAAKRIFTHQAEERITNGEHVGTFEEFAKSLTTRFLWEQNQYQALYQINPNELSQYDLVIDTANDHAPHIAQLIVDTYTKWLAV